VPNDFSTWLHLTFFSLHTPIFIESVRWLSTLVVGLELNHRAETWWIEERLQL